MEVYYNKINKKNETDIVPVRGVGLGNFDGVHLGHRAIIDTLVSECKKRNYSSMVYTFWNHPNNVLFEHNTLVIMSTDQKKDVFESLGIDELYFAKFDLDYAHMTPQSFVENVIVKELNAKLIVVGFDYSFGSYGNGKAEDLIQFGKQYGFDVIVIPPVLHEITGKNGQISKVTVSSTILRQLIKEGNISQYKTLTQSYYTIPGKVVYGNQRGSKFGYPTANIIPDSAFSIPNYGVYATQTVIGTKTYKSITNIGNNPTFGDVAKATVETHILDYEGQLYGCEISVLFLEKIRDEIKFSSQDALVSQITKDYNIRKNMEDELIEHSI